MQIRLSGIVNDSIVDGTGIRMTVFTQGCPHHCPGCHNPQTHDFLGGYLEDTAVIAEKFSQNPLLCGITLSGGEPFFQAQPLTVLCREIKAMGKDIWAYSGYTYEELLADVTPYARELLSLVDVLVDGKFEQEQSDLNLYFRGSSNQRLILVQQSLAQQEIVLLTLEE